MKRKEFLVSAALTAFSITACSNIEPLSNVIDEDCETTNDILGPFYRKNAPQRTDLTNSNLVGNRIQLNGLVYGDDCKTVLKDVLVEIWHCDTEGVYDNDSPEYRLRAVWKTNSNGQYNFKTILPGKYLNGKLYRPAHIHYKVSHPDYQDLISQLYFLGDPHIINDPWASLDKAKVRIKPIFLEDLKGGLSVNFDIYLKKKSNE